MSWSKERIELLQRLWEKGLSASQIASELGEGVTRNAVIGKAHRLGLKSRPSPLKAVPPQKQPAKQAKSGKSEDNKVTLLMLTDRICKWPIGHPGDPNFHFCGRRSQAGQPYCAKHAAMAYQSPQSRRDRQRSAAARSDRSR